MMSEDRKSEIIVSITIVLVVALFVFGWAYHATVAYAVH